MAKTGGPPKLNKERLDRIVQAVKMGLTRELAAAYAGIGRSTLQLWLADGRAGKSKEKIELVQALEQAEAEGAMACMARIQKAASEGTWQAAAWVLERRHGYRVPQSIEVSGPDGSAIQVNTFAELAKAAQS